MPTPDDQVTELKDLDVHEVSLVDAPAIRRKFLIIKREDAMSAHTDAVEAVAAEANAEVAEQETNQEVAAEVTKDEAQPEDVTEVAEAAEAAEAVEDVTTEKAEVQDDDAAEDTEVEKAKRMTANRLGRMYKVYEELGGLLKELAPPQTGGEAASQSPQAQGGELPNADQFSASQIVKEEIKKAVQEAVEEVLKAKAAHGGGAGGGSGKPAFLQDEEDEEAKGAGKKKPMKGGHKPGEKKPMAKSEEAPETNEVEALKEEVSQLRKQLSVLEGTPSAGKGDSTDTIEKSVSQSIWSGVL